MNRLIFSALGLGAALICTLPASAQDTVSIRVSYADLNLASAAGSTAFGRRIDAAVTQICGSTGGMDLTRAASAKSCRAQVGAAARAEMDRVVAEVRQPQTLASAKVVTLASR